MFWNIYLSILVVNIFPLAPFASDLGEDKNKVGVSSEHSKKEKISELKIEPGTLDSMGRKDIQEYAKAFKFAAKLDEPDQQCVAFHSRVSTCLITVAKFNQACEGLAFNHKALPSKEFFRKNVLAARSKLLVDLLDGFFLLNEFKFGLKSDSLLNKSNQVEASEINQSRREIGDSALIRLFKENFNTLFKGKTKRNYNILATTDSLFADSLARIANAKELPWIPCPEPQIPKNILPILSSLTVGKIVGPLKVPYGYLLIQLDTIYQIPSLNFEEALPILVWLPKKESKPDNNLELLLYRLFLDRKNDFIAPDSGQYRAWIVPNFPRKAGEFIRDIELRKKRKQVLKDTLTIQSMTVEQDSLPEKVREVIEQYSPLQLGELIGPIRFSLGVWYLQVVSIKKGGRILEFQEAKEIIRATLLKTPKDGFSELSLGKYHTVKSDRQKSLAKDYLLAQANSEGPAIIEGNVDFGEKKIEEIKEKWIRNEVIIKYVY